LAKCCQNENNKIIKRIFCRWFFFKKLNCGKSRGFKLVLSWIRSPAGIQKNSSALPVVSPFNVKSLLGCWPMVLHEKIGKKITILNIRKTHFFSSHYYKKKSYATINCIIHCHPIQKRFAISFNIHLTSTKSEDLLMWNLNFLLWIELRVQPTSFLKSGISNYNSSNLPTWKWFDWPSSWYNFCTHRCNYCTIKSFSCQMYFIQP
jgi:hypothetical protein